MSFNKYDWINFGLCFFLGWIFAIETGFIFWKQIIFGFGIGTLMINSMKSALRRIEIGEIEITNITPPIRRRNGRILLYMIIGILLLIIIGVFWFG